MYFTRNPEPYRRVLRNMEKGNSVDNGVEGLSKVINKLPAGFRFLPTDEEIVVHYWRKKASLSSIPSSIISEVDVFGTDPWNLPGDGNEKRYFFSRKIANRSRKRIKTDSGYWKTICKTKRISAILGCIRVAGVRRTLGFCNHCPDNHDGLIVSRWMLHEISLTGKEDSGDWAVYRLFRKMQRSSSKRVALPRVIPTLSPCSSSITDISCPGDLDQEVISIPFMSKYLGKTKE